MKSKTAVYLSGPITNNKNYRRQFSTAEEMIAGPDVAVLNPAALPQGLTQAQYMRISLAMLDSADVVLMLPGWERSAGARVEHDYALKVGKQVQYE